MSTHVIQRPVNPPRFPLPSAVSELAATIVGIMVIAPIALVASTGWLGWVGVAYGALWLVAMIPSSAAYLAMLLDAALLAFHKRPLLIPVLMYAEATGRQRHSDRPRVRSYVSRLAAVSFYLNPLAGPAMRFLRLATDARTTEILGLAQEIVALAKRETREHEEPNPVLFSPLATQVEMAEPVWRRAEPPGMLACM